MSFKVKFQVGNLPSNRLALTNKIYISPNNATQINSFYQGQGIEMPPSGYSVILDGLHPYTVEGHPQISDDTVGLNGLQRRYAKLSIAATVTLTPLLQPPPASTITIHVDTLSKAKRDPKAKPHEIDTDRLAQTAMLVLEGQVLGVAQSMAIDFEGTKLELTIHEIAGDVKKKKSKSSKTPEKAANVPMGQLLGTTQVSFDRAGGCTALQLAGERIAEGSSGGAQSIFLNDFDFEKLGIGGLDSQFNQIFRRAFATRIFPPSMIKQMGINHVRGMLLYGPPGCGKTLIARQIGKALNAREPKIVNGPEILNKYVGGSEEKIRELFKEAEQEQLEMGDNSMLHIVIMDEMGKYSFTCSYNYAPLFCF